MKEQLVKFETAILAKKKGFCIDPTSFDVGDGSSIVLCKESNESKKDYIKRCKEIYHKTGCFGHSPNDLAKLCSQSLLQKWLREKHNIHIDMYRNALGFQCNLDKAECGTHICKVVEYEELTYEQALEAGLKEALKRIP